MEITDLTRYLQALQKWVNVQVFVLLEYVSRRARHDQYVGDLFQVYYTFWLMYLVILQCEKPIKTMRYNVFLSQFDT